MKTEMYDASDLLYLCGVILGRDVALVGGNNHQLRNLWEILSQLTGVKAMAAPLWV